LQVKPSYLAVTVTLSSHFFFEPLLHAETTVHSALKIATVTTNMSVSPSALRRLHIRGIEKKNLHKSALLERQRRRLVSQATNDESQNATNLELDNTIADSPNVHPYVGEIDVEADIAAPNFDSPTHDTNPSTRADPRRPRSTLPTYWALLVTV
jgi:hypothetical protein